MGTVSWRTSAQQPTWKVLARLPACFLSHQVLILSLCRPFNELWDPFPARDAVLDGARGDPAGGPRQQGGRVECGLHAH